MSIRDRPLDWGICMRCHREAPGVIKMRRVIRQDGSMFMQPIPGGNGLCLFCNNGAAEAINIKTN
jgi:hypothetical protein